MGVWVASRVDADAAEVPGFLARAKSEGGGERREEKARPCGGAMGEHKFSGSRSCFYHSRRCFCDRDIEGSMEWDGENGCE